MSGCEGVCVWVWVCGCGCPLLVGMGVCYHNLVLLCVDWMDSSDGSCK